MPELKINKKTAALVVIDLQKGIAGRPMEPYTAHEVVGNAAKLVHAFRKNGMPVFLVHVVHAPETMLKIPTDSSFPRPPVMPPDWSEFVEEIAPVPSDIVIAKKQWGAFYGTDLELQLRRRGMDTIVLCGISTEYGVESTARFAYQVRLPAGLRGGRDDVGAGRVAPCGSEFHLKTDGPRPEDRRDPRGDRVKPGAAGAGARPPFSSLSRCRTRTACSGSCRRASARYWGPGTSRRSGGRVSPFWSAGVVYPWELIAGSAIKIY